MLQEAPKFGMESMSKGALVRSSSPDAESSSATALPLLAGSFLQVQPSLAGTLAAAEKIGTPAYVMGKNKARKGSGA